jgi:hypothetical protein
MVERMGANTHLRVEAGDHQLIACVNPGTRAKAGEPIDLVCAMPKVRLYDSQTGRLLV